MKNPPTSMFSVAMIGRRLAGPISPGIAAEIVQPMSCAMVKFMKLVRTKKQKAEKDGLKPTHQ